MGNGDGKKDDENGLRPVTKAHVPLTENEERHYKREGPVVIPGKGTPEPPPEDSGNEDD